MHISVRVKFWFFEHYWWLLCVAVVGAVSALLLLREPLPTIATVVGALLSVAYFLQKQKLEEMRLFRELFKECNARYDAMNEDLATITEKGDIELAREDRLKVVDYLNLCGEEYLYFKRGYIEPSVWQAWSRGMKAIVAAPAIQRIWRAEKSTGSYYDLPL
jgi:predicted NAD/FAD-binding protein